MAIKFIRAWWEGEKEIKNRPEKALHDSLSSEKEEERLARQMLWPWSSKILMYNFTIQKTRTKTKNMTSHQKNTPHTPQKKHWGCKVEVKKCQDEGCLPHQYSAPLFHINYEIGFLSHIITSTHPVQTLVPSVLRHTTSSSVWRKTDMVSFCFQFQLPTSEQPATGCIHDWRRVLFSPASLSCSTHSSAEGFFRDCSCQIVSSSKQTFF